MLISVIIPAYNAEKYLQAAIESVWAQKRNDLEILVINDGSTDRTLEIARSLNVRIFDQSNQGPSRARNRGLKESRGSFIAFLDADDLWVEDKLSTQLAYLEKHPEIGIVMGQAQRLVQEQLFAPFYAALLGCGLFRREVFEKVGLFDPLLQTGEDVDWFCRARENHLLIALLPTIALSYRRHNQSLTFNKSPQQLQVFEVLRRSLFRRKGQGERALPYPPLLTAEVPCSPL